MTASSATHSNPDADWGIPVPIAAPAADRANEPSQEAKVAKFLETAKSLQRLELFSNKTAHNRRCRCIRVLAHRNLADGRKPVDPLPAVSFMNASLHVALCGSSLRALMLDCKLKVWTLCVQLLTYFIIRFDCFCGSRAHLTIFENVGTAQTRRRA